MSRYRQNYFDRHIPEPRLSRLQLACYFAVILTTYTALSTLDYREARAEECARKSDYRVTYTYDSTTDKCVKEQKQNGTTQKN